ncbi:MAG TPA: thioredoxin domain-containing protein [Anaerolineales bacterium]|nr:thioredoxin domain-containing protein [Anaerolineales bacterium]
MNTDRKSKRQERREKAEQRERASRLRTMGLIVVGVAILVFLFISQQAKPIAGIVPVEPVARPNVDRNSAGDANAPIQIVEYSDFQCPFCKRFYTETETALEENFVKTGKIYFTYRSAGNWVSQNIGGVNTESQDAAAAAYCAADQNKFWEMHDALFSNNRDVENQGSFSDRRLTAIAESINLDMTAYQDCYDQGKYKDQVQQDFDDATAAGINGTPFFVMTYKVNGETKTEKIEGAQPITEFQQKIEAALLIADK